MKRTRTNRLFGRFRRVIAYLLVMSTVVLLLRSNVRSGAAALEETLTESTREEIISLRGKNTETYQLADGMRECVVYADDKYYRGDDGEWITIDNEIIAVENVVDGREYSFSNKSNNRHFYFSDEAVAGALEVDNKAIAFSMVSEGCPQVTMGGMYALSSFEDYSLCGANTIAYWLQESGLNVVYSASNNGLKEYIVMDGSSPCSAFSFSYVLRNLHLVSDGGNEVRFADNEGNIVFEFGSLFAVDALGNYTDKLTTLVDCNETGEISVTISIDEGFLNSCTFPVLVDPSIMITGDSSTQDSYVSSRYPSTNYYLNTYLRTGRDDDFYVRRTFLRFSIPSSLSGQNVTDAYVDIRRGSGATPNVRAYRVGANWTSSTITWNNMPAYATDNYTSPASYVTNDWYRLNVTQIVRRWVLGEVSNYGFMLKDSTESGTTQWTSFYSSDAPSPNKPELHVVYYYPGSRPYQQVNEPGIKCMGYALEYVYLNYAPISDSDLIGKTTAQTLQVMKTKTEDAMTIHFGTAHYGQISTYNSSINSNWFRVVVRVGFADLNNNGVVDSSDVFWDGSQYRLTWDYHWWYQTDTGDWAEKQGSLDSMRKYGTYASNPGNLTWPGDNMYYDSTAVYYQLDDLHDYGW